MQHFGLEAGIDAQLRPQPLGELLVDEERVSPLRHIALEGRCWVLGNGTAMRGRDVPPGFPARDRVFPDLESWFNSGDSAIVSPTGEVVAGPLHDEIGILYADCDPKAARNARRTLDVAGHYSRPDVFSLEVHVERRPPIRFETGPSSRPVGQTVRGSGSA
jgi:nitrilase